MLVKEISDTPDAFKRERLELIYSLCSSEVEVTESIIERAYCIREQSNIRTKDSIHLACAECAHVDVLLTVDKKFKDEWLNNINKALNGKKPAYLIVSHMEPDHSANIIEFLNLLMHKSYKAKFSSLEIPSHGVTFKALFLVSFLRLS